MSESISAADANRNFSHILRGVREEGTTYVVTAHGKPVAKIVPITDEREGAAREAAFKKMQERWASQPLLNIGPWTRDELYDD